MMEFKATDKWYKDAADLEDGEDVTICMPENAFNLIFGGNENAISQRKESNQ